MPWSIRARIAEVLLGCLFEGPEGGDKIQDADALLKVIGGSLTSILCVCLQHDVKIFGQLNFHRSPTGC